MKSERRTTSYAILRRSFRLIGICLSLAIMQSHESVGARAAFALELPLISISYVLLPLIALVPRVLNLGGFVTVDEIAFWIPRSDAFLRAIQAGDFPATAISTHP